MSTTLPHRHSLNALRCGASALAIVLGLSLATPAMAQLGFSIAVDGEHVAGDKRGREEPRATDVDLAEADIQVTYDGLGSERRLAAGLAGARVSDDGAIELSFALETNYAQWLQAAEIRVFGPNSPTPIAVLPVEGPQATWVAPAGLDENLSFVGRVYDRDGRYDETMLSTLSLTELRAAGKVGPRMLFGKDNTAARNIPVHGGTVTVRGTSIPRDAEVRVMGEAIPVDGSGRFAVDRILPVGDHVVDIAVARPDGKLVTFRRDINIPDAEWFYVGLADLTVGTRWGTGRVVSARPEEFDAVYYKGRAAFYLKGKIRGEYLLTASADTGSGTLGQMVSGMVSPDPQSVLRRIDPDQYYPVYGDDSVLVNDAPTDGKLYVRLERGDSHVMWGNFRTEVGDASMLRTERQLYGASAHYEADSVTADGAPRLQATAYAAQPGTLPARDVLRGTGGSAYVLRRQDIVRGSETVVIDTVNAVTGALIESRRLRPGLDYSINYMQGLVILKTPLSATRPSDGAVQSSQPAQLNLVVSYEYTPAEGAPDDYALGASASAWLGDHLRVGAVALAETDAAGESVSVVGVNGRLEASATTFIEAELLRSEGTGRAEWLSIDGGFTFVQQAPVAATGEAYAYRVKAQADLSELGASGIEGVAGVMVEGRQAGFTTLGQQTRFDTLLLSAYVDADLSADLGLRVDADHIENASGVQRTELGAELRYELTEDLSIKGGLRYRQSRRPGGAADDNGSRTDAGLRASYDLLDGVTLHAFGQATLHATPGYARNDRIGLGAEWQVNDEWSVGAEASLGTSGPQALATINHTTESGDRTYLGLALAPDSRDDFFVQSRPVNGLVAGSERRLNEATSAFVESTFGLLTDEGRSSSIYGLSFEPDKAWQGTATYETGQVVDDLAGTLERHALSGALSYADEGVKWTNRAELRLESSDDGSKDRNTFLAQSAVSVETSEDWRLLAGVNALISQSDQASFLDGDYVEATIGAAYRPADNDRLNMLARYTYLYDLPGPEQVSRNGGALGPAQRSHIMSVDANYDLTEYLTVGAKYGFRIGEVSATRVPDGFEASSAHLGVVRADLGIVTDWHVLLEGRALYQPESETLDMGGLVMVSYDIDDAIRAGLGYNFGMFSDDLADLTYDDGGIFFNLSARY